MGLAEPNVVDAIGIEKTTGHVVLTIADGLDWSDAREHILALKEKMKAYLLFVETGEIWSSYPSGKGRSIVIDVVHQFSLPPEAEELMHHVGLVAAELQVTIRSSHVPMK
ncbi:MAG: DUF6572 domain-containing protein [Flavobacteriales bacterium]